MSYLANQLDEERAQVGEEQPGHAPASGGMPSFGGALGHGLLVGLMGGAACNLVLMAILGVGAVIGNLPYGISLGDAVGALFWAIVFLAAGTLVAAPIGMIIGGLSATLMWLALSLLRKRDERTRKIVGAVCAGVVAICAVVTALNLLAGQYQSSLYDTYTNPLMLIFLPEAIAVTITGAWFAKRYLEDEI